MIPKRVAPVMFSAAKSAPQKYFQPKVFEKLSQEGKM